MAAGSHQKLYAIIVSALLLLILASALPVPLDLPIVIGVALILFLILGFGFGRFWPDVSWRWSVWLMLPVAIIVVMDLFISPPELLMRDLVILSCAIAGGAIGGLVGTLSTHKKKEVT